MLIETILGVTTNNMQGRTKNNFVFQLASLMSLVLVGMVRNVLVEHFANETKLVATDLNTAGEHLPVIRMIEICNTASGALSA